MAKARKVVPISSKRKSQTPPFKWPLYLAFAVAVAAPMVFSRVTFDQFDIAKLAVVRLLTLALLLFWLFRPRRDEGEELRYSTGDFLLFAFLGAVLVSTVLSVSFTTSLIGKYKRYEGLLSFFGYAMLYFLGAQIFRSSRETAKLSKVIVGTAYIVAAYGLMQFMQLDPINWGSTPFEARKAFATFGNPDLLAGYLAFVLPISLAELASRVVILSDALKASSTSGGSLGTPVVNVALRFLGFLIIVGALLLTFTRGAWLAGTIGLAGFLVSFVVIIIRHHAGNKAAVAKVVAALMAVTLLVMGIVVVGAARTGDVSLDVVARVRSIASFTEGSAGTRLEIWQSGLNMIRSRPVFGFGPDTFRLMSERYETSRYVKMTNGTSVADNAHNYFIQIGAGAGLIALAFLIAFLAFWLHRAPAVNEDSRGLGAEDRLIRAGMYWAAVGYLAYLVTGISVVGTSAVFWLLLGAMIGTSASERSVTSTGNLSPDSFRAILATSLIVPMMFVTGYGVANLMGDYYFAKAVNSAAAGDLNESTRHLGRAGSLYPGNSRYYTEIGRYLLSYSRRGGSDLVNEATKLFETARRVEPMETDNYMFLGAARSTQWELSQRDSDIAASNSLLREGLRQRPYSAAGHYLLGSNYLRQKRFEAALTEFKAVEELAPGYQQLDLLFAETYKGLGDTKKAAEYQRKAGGNRPE